MAQKEFRRVGNMKYNWKGDFSGADGLASANHFLRQRLRRAERRGARHDIEEQLDERGEDILTEFDEYRRRCDEESEVWERMAADLERQSEDLNDGLNDMDDGFTDEALGLVDDPERHRPTCDAEDIADLDRFLVLLDKCVANKVS